MRVAVFGTKDGTNLKNALHVTRNTHLLAQLRALRQICLALEVLDLKHVAAALGRRAHQLGRKDPPRAALKHVLGEQLSDAGGDPGDSLVGLGLQIEHAVVKAGLERDERRSLGVEQALLVALWGRLLGILDLHGQHRYSLGHHVDFTDVQLRVAQGRGGNGHLWRLEHAGDLHDRIDVDAACPLDHLPRDFVRRSHDSLRLLALLPQHEKAELGAGLAAGVRTRNDSDFISGTSALNVEQVGDGGQVGVSGQGAVAVGGDIIRRGRRLLCLLLRDTSSSLLGLCLVLGSLFERALAGTPALLGGRVVSGRGTGGGFGRRAVGLGMDGEGGLVRHCVSRGFCDRFGNGNWS